MAEGGLTSLPVPDYMFDEHTFAGGGIVAFDAGGDARAERIKALMAIERMGGPKGRAAMKELNQLTGITRGASEGPTLGGKSLADIDIASRAANEASGQVPFFHGLNGQPNPDLYNYVAPQDLKLPTPAPASAPPPAQKAATSLMLPPGQGVLKAPQSTPAAAPRPRVDFAARARDVVKAAAAKPEAKTEATATPALTGDALIEQRKKDFAEAYKMPEYKGTSAEDKAARKKEDFWSAMAQAGFGMMAGTSQNALTNIGEGLKAAMPTMQASLKERRADEKEERKEEFASLLAQAGVKGKAYEFGIDQFDKQTKAKQEMTLAQMGIDARAAEGVLDRKAQLAGYAMQRDAPTAGMKDYRFYMSLSPEGRKEYLRLNPPYNPMTGFAGANTALSAAQTALQQAKMTGTPADVSAAQARVTQLMSMQESMLPGGGNPAGAVPAASYFAK